MCVVYRTKFVYHMHFLLICIYLYFMWKESDSSNVRKTPSLAESWNVISPGFTLNVAELASRWFISLSHYVFLHRSSILGCKCMHCATKKCSFEHNFVFNEYDRVFQLIKSSSFPITMLRCSFRSCLLWFQCAMQAGREWVDKNLFSSKICFSPFAKGLGLTSDRRKMRWMG